MSADLAMRFENDIAGDASRNPVPSLRRARIETPESLIQLHSFRPVEDALQQAFRWMLDWVVEDHGMRPIDAYRLMSIAPGVRIHVYQMVKLGRIAYTVGVEFPKAYLVP